MTLAAAINLTKITRHNIEKKISLNINAQQVTKNVFIIGNSKGILEGIAPKRELN
jgi:hypothetical protein